MRRAVLLTTWITAAVALADPAAPVAPATLGTMRGDVALFVPISLALRGEGVGGYPVDRYGNRFAAGGALSPRLRVGLLVDTRQTFAGARLIGEYEHDLPTGAYALRPALAGAAMPDTEAISTALRKASLKLAFKAPVQVGAGVMTSHWGLGLVANDGAHGWSPGSARFGDPRGGDRVLRAFAATGPFGRFGLSVLVAADRVWDDDVLLTSEEAPAGGTSDGALQFSAALLAGAPDGPRFAGAYVAHRRLRTGDGRALDATVIDATARWLRDLGERRTLELAFEGALVAGSTDLAATPEHPTQAVRQLGLVARAAYSAANAGGVVDVVFASGDQNPDDGVQSGFRADPNHEVGLLLFRHVLAAHTGRAAATAGDPNLVGVPSQGLDRFASRGSVTNTVAFFPRAWWRPTEKLEVYGGPLVALSAEPLADPLNTRVAGGVPRNALDGAPGAYLGTELDVGLRLRLGSAPRELVLGLECAALVPGAALATAAGDSMDPVFGGRAVVDFRY